MNHKVNRRCFLKTAATVGGAVTLSRFKVAHGDHPNVQPRIIPIRRREIPNTQVAFVKTDDRVEGVKQALGLLGINPVEGKQLLIKPNFNSSDPCPGSTHNDTLSTLVTEFQAMGADHITVGDRSYEGARTVMNAKGIFDMAEKLGFEPMSFNDIPATLEGWELVQPESSHWEFGFLVARAVTEAEALVSTCCLKTHGHGGRITMSLKNSVGVVPKFGPAADGEFVDFMSDLHASPDQRRMIAEINVAYEPDLIVLDGVDAFTAGGPDTGELAHPQVILAGTDRVAIDAVGVAILRKFGASEPFVGDHIFEDEQIARAVELGLGVDSADKIELITGDADSAAYADEIQNLLLEYA